MALADNLVVTDSSNASKTFVLTSRNGNTTRRIDESSATSTPRYIDIGHQQLVRKGRPTAEKHLVSVTDTALSVSTGIPRLIVNVTCEEVPGSFTDAEVADAVKIACDLVSSNLAKIRRGES